MTDVRKKIRNAIYAFSGEPFVAAVLDAFGVDAAEIKREHPAEFDAAAKAVGRLLERRDDAAEASFAAYCEERGIRR